MLGRQHRLPTLEAAPDCGHTCYRTALLQDSRADTVDSAWCPSSRPARVPAPSAQALEHRDGLRQDHLACHNRPSACPGALGGPCPVAYLTRRLDGTPYMAEAE